MSDVKLVVTRSIGVLAKSLLALFIGGVAVAGEEKLECKLYIAESMDSSAMEMVAVESAGESLRSLRRAAYCVFSDGTIADKQFVMINRIMDGGKSGDGIGFSIYTMANGDSISAQFTGAGGEGPFNGIYEILGGTGEYKGATGDGTISSIDSPWKTTGIVDIVMNVATP